MTEQPARHTADTITDNDLDQLYTELADAQARASTAATHWGYVFGLLSQAVDWLPACSLRDRIDAVLTAPKEPLP
ncbi:hypothetical protein ACODT5_15495 [Streptomyces sp. 5.8]|uniref:hypothetical protein n=1 Tax=Streptomyces sp. 5.8 TaxID=3406571 RepID=UPI003BB7B9C3